MTDAPTKLPVRIQRSSLSGTPALRWPMLSLRNEIDRLFDDFDRSFWSTSMRRSIFDYLPFTQAQSSFSVPAVDIAEKDNEYEITAEIPGMSEKDVEVSVASGRLVIKGQKKSEKEETKKDYFLSERHYGAFERSFVLPEGVDSEKIAASFKNGILTVALPKTAEAKKHEKKIEVKTAA